MGYEAKILADSISPDGCRLTTFEVTFPRIVLAEFNTHRMLSRNSASSRAIPVEKRIAAVEADPFVPEVFGKNQKGMQAGEALEGDAHEKSRETWLYAARLARQQATILNMLGVHKQLANRLLEPFSWHTVIVSATEWTNWDALRCSDKAQPEIRKPAEMMRELRLRNEPTLLRWGGWHRPLLPDEEELRSLGFDEEFLCLVSIGRCARVSYLTHEGKRAPSADVALAQRLMKDGHMSPFEHVAEAYPVSREGFVGNFRGWKQYRKHIPNEHDFALAQAST